MNCIHMYFQATLCFIAVITDWAFVWFLSFMNWVDMPFQVTICCTAVITNWALVWLLSFMNCIRMYFQVVFCCKVVITNWALVWFLFFRNFIDMFAHVTLGFRVLHTSKSDVLIFHFYYCFINSRWWTAYVWTVYTVLFVYWWIIIMNYEWRKSWKTSLIELRTLRQLIIWWKVKSDV